MSGEIIGVQGVRITDLPEAEAVVDSNYMILVDEETGRTYKVKREHIKAQKTSELVDDIGFLRAIPDEYMTESEVREFTNAEIAQIREVLNTWEAFKNSGGVINGDIKLPRGFALCGTINGNRDALIYQSSQPSDNGRVIVGSSGQTTQIASELRPEVYWNLQTHRIILDSDYVSNKSDNGYTKLPNGLIMQWLYVGGSLSQGKGVVEGNLPMTFPNGYLSIFANVTYVDDSSTYNNLFNCNAKFVNKGYFNVNIKNLESNSGSFANCYVFAIGY